ncbi:MAG TPA: hypothetical protein VMY42_12265 [Thermoguttaceae bacterium]|nr:hypothetical protein [Thermoguttaceae bacterium]
MYQRCIDHQTAPGNQPGDTINEGEFFRNLKKDHVAKCYGGDDEHQPEYGLKLRKRHWQYWGQQRSGLSVNLRSCIHSEVCSIALQSGGEDYFHVAIIDLGAINACGLLSSSFVAQYDPAPPNMCHFVILPLDGTVSKWMELAEVLDTPFPPANKLPATSDEKARARLAFDQYRSYIDVRRWVRKTDGSLH